VFSAIKSFLANADVVKFVNGFLTGTETVDLPQLDDGELTFESAESFVNSLITANLVPAPVMAAADNLFHTSLGWSFGLTGPVCGACQLFNAHVDAYLSYLVVYAGFYTNTLIPNPSLSTSDLPTEPQLTSAAEQLMSCVCGANVPSVVNEIDASIVSSIETVIAPTFTFTTAEIDTLIDNAADVLMVVKNRLFLRCDVRLGAYRTRVCICASGGTSADRKLDGRFRGYLARSPHECTTHPDCRRWPGLHLWC